MIACFLNSIFLELSNLLMKFLMFIQHTQTVLPLSFILFIILYILPGDVRSGHGRPVPLDTCLTSTTETRGQVVTDDPNFISAGFYLL